MMSPCSPCVPCHQPRPVTRQMRGFKYFWFIFRSSRDQTGAGMTHISRDFVTLFTTKYTRPSLSITVSCVMFQFRLLSCLQSSCPPSTRTNSKYIYCVVRVVRNNCTSTLSIGNISQQLFLTNVSLYGSTGGLSITFLISCDTV